MKPESASEETTMMEPRIIGETPGHRILRLEAEKAALEKRVVEAEAKAALATAYLEVKSCEKERAMLRGASQELARRAAYSLEQARKRLDAAYDALKASANGEEKNDG